MEAKCKCRVEIHPTTHGRELRRVIPCQSCRTKAKPIKVDESVLSILWDVYKDAEG